MDSRNLGDRDSGTEIRNAIRYVLRRAVYRRVQRFRKASCARGQIGPQIQAMLVPEGSLATDITSELERVLAFDGFVLAEGDFL